VHSVCNYLRTHRVDNLQCRLSYTRTDVHIEAHTYCKLVKVVLSGLLVKIIRSNQIGDIDDGAGGQVCVRMELRNEPAQDSADSNAADSESKLRGGKPLMAKLMVSVYLQRVLHAARCRLEFGTAQCAVVFSLSHEGQRCTRPVSRLQ
jgi:hypothetical protein